MPSRPALPPRAARSWASAYIEAKLPSSRDLHMQRCGILPELDSHGLRLRMARDIIQRLLRDTKADRLHVVRHAPYRARHDCDIQSAHSAWRSAYHWSVAGQAQVVEHGWPQIIQATDKLEVSSIIPRLCARRGASSVVCARRCTARTSHLDQRQGLADLVVQLAGDARASCSCASISCWAYWRSCFSARIRSKNWPIWLLTLSKVVRRSGSREAI